MAAILTKSTTAGSISQLITVIFIFIIVLGVTVWATKLIGNYQKMQGYNRNLEIIETLRITNNKFLQIVRVADKYIVIGIGKDEVSMITEIDGDELLKVSAEKGNIKESFTDIINKAKSTMVRKQDDISDTKNDNNE